MDLAWLVMSRLFQSTLSQGERLTGEFIMIGLEIFQSTLSQGERPPLPKHIQRTN